MNLTGVISNSSLYTTTSFPLQPSERTQPRLPKSKTTFKLALEVFCAWQAYVKRRKARKAEKKRLLTLIIRAINFHEHALLTKSLKGLRQAKGINLKIAHAYKCIKRKQELAILQFYLRLMVNARLGI